MTLLILGLAVFHGMHALRAFAPHWRSAQIDRLGENAWKGIFSLVTIGALAAIIWGYSSIDDAAMVYQPPDFGRPVALGVTLIAFVLMTFNMRSSRLSAITRHPFMLAVILWSAAHLLLRGDLASILLFGSFLVWSIWAYWYANKRGDPLPPVAPLLQDIGASIVGVLIWLAFYFWIHGWLIGVPLS